MDNPHNPDLEGGLIPDEEAQINPHLLTDDTPDTFGTPVDSEENEEEDEDIESESPDEGVYPGDTEFEENLEDEEIRRYNKD